MRLRIRPGIGQPKDMSPLTPAVMPPLAARLAIEGGLQLPDRRFQRLPERTQRRQGDAVAAAAVGLKEVEASLPVFLD